MNLIAEREARAELANRQRRYLAGDGADWFEMYRRGRATDDEVFSNTGFTIESARIVAVPLEQFQRVQS